MRATHFRIAVRYNDGSEIKGCLATACGRHGTAHLASYDPRDIDCIRCKKTKRYKRSMGIIK